MVSLTNTFKGWISKWQNKTEDMIKYKKDQCKLQNERQTKHKHGNNSVINPKISRKILNINACKIWRINQKYGGKNDYWMDVKCTD